MSVEILVPPMGESVTEATVGQWVVAEGDTVQEDEVLVELETEKVTIEVRAPKAGALAKINARAGDVVQINGLLGLLEEGKGTGAAPVKGKAAPASGPAPAAPAAAADLSPAVRKIVAEKSIDPATILGSGKDGRILKGDLVKAQVAVSPAVASPAPVRTPAASDVSGAAVRAQPGTPAPHGGEERVRMSRLRQTIARRLKDAQNTAAMLTTFNEVDMSAVMDVRNRYKDVFEKKHGVKLGFMSFFVKACVQALRDVPSVNAEIDGEDIVYKNYYHIGVAVGTDKGLVVPVLRNADTLSFAEVEKSIAAFGKRARDGQLQIADMQGGTFTISNGGIYGSLMSTPILNAPQSGILGMHKIQERPIVQAGQIVARPMMYLALSYDHRIVDGKEAVTFLVRIKEAIEDPQRALLDL